ncbi:MAG: hypothetical protein KGL74_04575 [Elusimicrobia bacterium]|nr:hypothetical protein [Elusimicrobiota bacterium]
MKSLIFSAVCAVSVLVSTARAQAWRPYFHESLAARVASVCPQVSPVMIGGTQGYADSLSSGHCFVSIDPTDSTGLVYRAHAFFDDGLLMVFNSYGDGEGNPNLTSAREFFFFPRRGTPELTMDAAAGVVSVRMSDGGRVNFNPATAQIASLERGAVTVVSRIDPADRGGVEIPRYAGLMLDAGFRLGESPSGRPNAESTFRDAQGKTCAVKNNELFNYTPDGDHALKFTDAQLSAWLATRCPGLSAGF